MDEQVIEVRYAGIVVAKSATVRDQDANGFFLGVGEPMPVGTILNLTIDGAAKHGRVEQVIESLEGTRVGMRIRLVAAPPSRSAPVAGAAAAPAAAVAPAAAETAAAETAAPAAVMPADRTSGPVVDDDGSAAGEREAAGGPTENGGGDANPGQGGGGRRRRRRR